MEKRAARASLTHSRLNERGSLFLEAAVVLPAFIFIVFAGIQIFVVSWRLSQVQLQASELARLLAIPVNNAYPCAQVVAAARMFGATELGVQAPAPVTIQVMQRQPDGSYRVGAAPNNCPEADPISAERQTAVLTLEYQAPLFVAQLFPGGANFTYRGTAVAVLEKPLGGNGG